MRIKQRKRCNYRNQFTFRKKQLDNGNIMFSSLFSNNMSKKVLQRNLKRSFHNKTPQNDVHLQKRLTFGVHLKKRADIFTFRFLSCLQVLPEILL